MNSKTRNKIINSLLEQHCTELKEWPRDKLAGLGAGTVLQDAVVVGSRTYQFSAFVKEAPDSKLLVFVETWRPFLLGLASSRYFRGFEVGSSGEIIDIPDEKLWQYD